MRKVIVSLPVVFAILLAGCAGGSVDSDLKKPADEVRKDAEKMSVADIEKRMDELEKRSKKMEAEAGGKEPSDKQMKEATKLIEVGGIYATELMKRKLKR